MSAEGRNKYLIHFGVALRRSIETIVDLNQTIE
jgi:hypothetical protein